MRTIQEVNADIDGLEEKLNKAIAIVNEEAKAKKKVLRSEYRKKQTALKYELVEAARKGNGLG